MRERLYDRVPPIRIATESSTARGPSSAARDPRELPVLLFGVYPPPWSETPDKSIKEHAGNHSRGEDYGREVA